MYGNNKKEYETQLFLKSLQWNLNDSDTVILICDQTEK